MPRPVKPRSISGLVRTGSPREITTRRRSPVDIAAAGIALKRLRRTKAKHQPIQGLTIFRKNAAIRFAAEELLANLETNNRIGQLIRIITTSEDPEHTKKAIFALGLIGSPLSILTLTILITRGDEPQKSFAIEALEANRRPPSRGGLAMLARGLGEYTRNE